MANVLGPWRYGQILYNSNDWPLGNAFHRYHEYAEREANVYRQLLRPGDFTVEVGANCGALTVPLARFVGPAGAVIAIEPQRQMYYLLCGNIALNNCRNVNAILAAVGDRSGSVTVPAVNYEEPGGFGCVSLTDDADWRRDADTATETVPLVTLDGLLAGAVTVRLLKIDCEGMETAVLRGAEALVDRARPLIYCENNQRAGSEPLIALLRSYGYRLWWHVSHLWNPDNFAGVPYDSEDRLIGVCAINMLCAPREVKTEFSLEPVTGPIHPMMS
jgi:FkbM family methyltransferase